MFLRGDGGVQLQELMDVMDRLKAAGVEKVGIVAKLPGNGRTRDEGRGTPVRTMDAVSPILIERAQEPQGLRNMVVVSLVVHAVVRRSSISWSPRPSFEAPPTTVMTISLSAGQVNSGGMTPMAGRAAEAATPDEKPAPVAPPAPKPAEMVLPTSKAKTPPKATQKKAPDDAKSKVVPKAAEASRGDARVDTGLKTTGFGLSTGGGGGRAATSTCRTSAAPTTWPR